MEPDDLFKFVMEIDRLADPYRLGDKSVTELRKCVIIVTGTSASHEMEYRMVDNNPAYLIRVLLKTSTTDSLSQQQASKTVSASKGTVMANRDKGKK